MKFTIEQVLLKYGQNLKRSGNDYIILCPFHKDTNPSCSVDSKSGIFHCWSCGEKGNIYKLVSRLEGIDYKDAVKKLKDGVEYFKVKNQKEETKIQKKELDERYYELYNLLRLLFFREIQDRRLGKELMKYLKKCVEFRVFIEHQKILKEGTMNYNLEMKKCLLEHIYDIIENYYKDNKYLMFIELCEYYGFQKYLNYCIKLMRTNQYQHMKVEIETIKELWNHLFKKAKKFKNFDIKFDKFVRCKN